MFSEKLKAWRRRKGLSVYAVAEMLGVTPSAVSNWETGIRHPKRAIWKRIVEVTEGEITVDDLAGISPKSPAGVR